MLSRRDTEQREEGERGRERKREVERGRGKEKGERTCSYPPPLSMLGGTYTSNLCHIADADVHCDWWIFSIMWINSRRWASHQLNQYTCILMIASLLTPKWLWDARCQRGNCQSLTGDVAPASLYGANVSAKLLDHSICLICSSNLPIIFSPYCRSWLRC